MEAVILKLNEIGGIKFGNFTLKSGIISPIYLDLRVLIAYPKFMEQIADLMWKLVSNQTYDQICGVPYTALPIATIVSLKQNIPMIMKRKEPKTHGTKKQLEGIWKHGDTCLLIEDVIVSGSSVMETVETLKSENLSIKQTVVFIDRQQGGRANLEKKGIQIKSVLTLDQIVDVLLAKKAIELDVAENVREFVKTNCNVKFPPISRYKFRVRKYPVEKRMEMVDHPVAKKLFQIMEDKESALCVAADVSSTAKLLKIADEVGPYICVLKTHVDMLCDFNLDTIVELKKRAAKNNFLIMEDRKFADIGKTVASQYAEGMHKIASFADLVTVHGLPGDGVIAGLKSVAGKSQACLIVAEMSSEGNLCDQAYTQACIDMAKKHPDFVIGFVAQSNLAPEMNNFIMTPGISLDSISDPLGQKYKSPAVAIRDGTDIIIVGRSIILNKDPGGEASKYNVISYQFHRGQNTLGLDD